VYAALVAAAERGDHFFGIIFLSYHLFCATYFSPRRGYRYEILHGILNHKQNNILGKTKFWDPL
jgi:hypothetical protein